MLLLDKANSLSAYAKKVKGLLAGFALMINLTADLSSNSSTHRELGPDYQRSTVRRRCKA